MLVPRDFNYDLLQYRNWIYQHIVRPPLIGQEWPLGGVSGATPEQIDVQWNVPASSPLVASATNPLA